MAARALVAASGWEVAETSWVARALATARVAAKEVAVFGEEPAVVVSCTVELAVKAAGRAQTKVCPYPISEHEVCTAFYPSTLLACISTYKTYCNAK